MTTSPPSPPALRLRRPGWRDPRLVIGVLLVAAAMVIGSRVVADAAATVPVYAAARPLVSGEALASDALVVREVRLADCQDRYLLADAAVPSGLVVLRTVGAGELVPLSAVAPGAQLGLRLIGITPSQTLPSGVVPGAAVDLWYIPATPGFDVETVVRPQLIAAELTVAEITDAGSGFAVGGDRTVQVLVPTEDLADVLAALAGDGSVAIVHVPGGLG